MFEWIHDYETTSSKIWVHPIGGDKGLPFFSFGEKEGASIASDAGAYTLRRRGEESICGVEEEGIEHPDIYAVSQ